MFYEASVDFCKDRNLYEQAGPNFTHEGEDDCACLSLSPSLSSSPYGTRTFFPSSLKDREKKKKTLHRNSGESERKKERACREEPRAV